ncbi:MAG: hypothetical protein J6D23_04220 [Clostridia bacterium]|nr:hypothetical protein [Clostridia bacterium]
MRGRIIFFVILLLLTENTMTVNTSASSNEGSTTVIYQPTQNENSNLAFEAVIVIEQFNLKNTILIYNDRQFVKLKDLMKYVLFAMELYIENGELKLRWREKNNSFNMSNLEIEQE